MWSLDDDGRITLINAAACKMLECSREDALGKNWFDLFVGEERRDNLRARYARRMSDRESTSLQVYTELRSHRGNPRYVQSQVSTLYDADSKACGTLISAIDCTELEHTESLLEQAQKLELIGQLSGGIAHDFNNLLQVIAGNAGLLQDDPTAADESVEEILKAAHRGSELTKRLLAYARKQRLMPEPVDLQRLLDSVRQLLLRTFPDNIRPLVEDENTRCVAHVDRNQLEDALLNLCINARDAMPLGGKLILRCFTSGRDVSLPASLEGLSPEEMVAVSVEDEGGGIPPENLPHIFEPFFTTKDDGVGNGLGLSMVRGFARQSGGDIAVRSTVGSGSTFTLFLPASMAQESIPEIGSPRPIKARANELVLVLEDNESVRDMVVSMLTSLDYEAIGVADTDSARETIDARPDIDLVISDIMLAGQTNGVEFAREIRTSRPAIPFLFMTGYSDGPGESAGNLVGSESVLDKPFSLAQLADAIRKSLSTD